MTYDEFKTKYNNKYWDADGYYGFQCADLITFYSRELGLPHLTGNAADAANQYPSGYTHVSSPSKGDIVVFARNAANGYAGHIAILDRAGYYLSQNYPTGSNTHVQRIDEPIIAILRPTTLGGNLPYSTEQFNDLAAELSRAREEGSRLAYNLYLGREPSRDERRLRLDKPLPEVEAILNSSEEKAAIVSKYFLDLLGRPAKPEEIAQRRNQTVVDLVNDLESSAERKAYLKGIPQTEQVEPVVTRIKQQITDFISKLKP